MVVILALIRLGQIPAEEVRGMRGIPPRRTRTWTSLVVLTDLLLVAAFALVLAQPAPWGLSFIFAVTATALLLGCIAWSWRQHREKGS